MTLRGARALEAVIFDLDGVLINSVPAITIALEHAFADYGFTLGDLDVDHRAHSVKMILAEVRRVRGLHIDHDEFATKLVEHILRQLENEKVDPGLLGLLENLTARGIHLAVASSSTRPSVEGKLRILGLGRFFDIVVTAEDVARHKPAPDMYLQALKLLGADPAHTIVVEDTRSGIESAQAAGIRTVGFGKYTEDSQADLGADLYAKDWKDRPVRQLQALIESPGST